MSSSSVVQLLEKFNTQGLQKYQALFHSNMIGIAITDFNDTILMANDAFLSMLGYTQEDLESGSLKWSTISPNKYNDTDIEKMDELHIHKQLVPFEKEYVHKKGYPVAVLVGAEALEDDLSLGVCFALDITHMKALERKKDEFIGTVSHELKTPLSVMKLYADFLKTSIEEGASKEELLDSAKEVGTQVDKLSVMITDLLNMARYQANEAAFLMSGLNLSECVKNIVSELSLVSDRNIIYQGEKPVYVNANQARLSQVITNLVNNALRYSKNDTDIIVRVFKDERNAYIQVQDFGVGINEEDQEKIFERYYRITHAESYSDTIDSGAGIGLYVCSEIVKHHNGTISVQSKLGEGSTFTISLALIN